MLNIFIHSMFVEDSDTGQTDFVCENVAGKTLREVLEEAANGDRRILTTMIDERGCFRPHVAVFFGDQQQRGLERPDVNIGEDVSEISIFPALSGG